MRARHVPGFEGHQTMGDDTKAVSYCSDLLKSPEGPG